MTCWRWWRGWLGRTPAYDCLIVATVAATVLILCTVREWWLEEAGEGPLYHSTVTTTTPHHGVGVVTSLPTD